MEDREETVKRRLRKMGAYLSKHQREMSDGDNALWMIAIEIASLNVTLLERLPPGADAPGDDTLMEDVT